ncbi:hypothetical protein ACE193_00515 [Bernardetia sp. OM2101]|uniref:hypothetical protein n=1 Tax=Bernardetia sp. OM2101 TaxID=3344876 RepID=UPI0035D068F9
MRNLKKIVPLLFTIFLLITSCDNKNKLLDISGTYNTFDVSYKGVNLIQSNSKIAFAKQIQIDNSKNNIFIDLGYDNVVIAKLDYKNDSTLAIYKSSDKRFNGKYKIRASNSELELESDDIYIYAEKMNFDFL